MQFTIQMNHCDLPYAACEVYFTVNTTFVAVNPLPAGLLYLAEPIITITYSEILPQPYIQPHLN
jgi:hypothetical protein